jgi:hypothetical protein
MKAHAKTFLGDVEAKPDSPEAGVAHRAAGLTHWFAGDYAEARKHLERALTLFQPGRDDDQAFRFGNDALGDPLLEVAPDTISGEDGVVQVDEDASCSRRNFRFRN